MLPCHFDQIRVNAQGVEAASGTELMLDPWANVEARDRGMWRGMS